MYSISRNGFIYVKKKKKKKKAGAFLKKASLKCFLLLILGFYFIFNFPKDCLVRTKV